MKATVVALSAVVALAGCTALGTFVDADGEVYECENRVGERVELCYFADSAEELAELTSSTSCGLTDRWWPVFTNAIGRGCRYSCTATTPGCNAKQGCYCDGR